LRWTWRHPKKKGISDGKYALGVKGPSTNVALSQQKGRCQENNGVYLLGGRDGVAMSGAFAMKH